MSSAGIRKPPVAPKPRQSPNQRRVLSPQPPRTDVPSYLSPDIQRKVKPPVAPKPCRKPSTAGASRPQSSESPQGNFDSETLKTNGHLKSQNGVWQSKRPEWDYIIPICFCRQNNCTCIRSPQVEQKEKNFKTSHNNKKEENGKTVPLWLDKQNNNRAKPGDVQCKVTNSSVTNACAINHELNERFNINPDSETTRPVQISGPSLPHRTRSNQISDAVLQGVVGGRQADDSFGSKQTNVLQHMSEPGPIRKPPPVPITRKPKTAAPSHQEMVDKEREETPIQERRESIVSSNGKDSPSPSVSIPDSENNQPVHLSARRACPPPAPLPRKKPLLPDATKAPTSAAQRLSEDVEHARMQVLNTQPCKMKESIGKKNEEMQKKVRDDKEGTHPSPSCTFLNQTELSKTSIMTRAAEVSRAGQASQMKPRRHNSSVVLRRFIEPSEKKEVGESLDLKARQVNTLYNGALKEMMTRELPSPPVETSSGSIKHSRFSPTKKSKSFSSADLQSSDGHKVKTLRKILDLKRRKKKTTKGDEKNPYHSVIDFNGSAHKDCDAHQRFPEHPGVEPKDSPQLLWVEQSVDGDEFTAGYNEDPVYDNSAIYDEISDYENVLIENSTSPSPTTYRKTQPSPANDSESIYEEQEPYLSLMKNSLLIRPPIEFDRCSGDEEVAVFDDTFSEDDSGANTSDEEDEEDSSSVSSKGDPEQPEGSTVQIATKKSNIQHIATEIMSSESVFVDVLKLLHVDFRESVNKASQQSGKPVIEERLLNQILYYLPQLYELNQNLLIELKQRVTQWDENSQVADIFLKKGPFLKMYSTYIREFDKNVTLLEEQTKKNSAFGAVVKDFEASPRCAHLALKHYLLKPVQRIPQYQLLLTDYLKNLSKDSDDYKDTQAALALVKEVANHANDIIKHGDNFQKLMQVQCCLSGNQEIIQPGRIFLKEGVLMKRSRKVMQPRKFFLFNDALLYTIPVQSGQLKIKNMLSLSGMRVSKPSQEAYQNELNIESVERSFILSASSAAKRDEWLEAISTAIGEYTKKKISFTCANPDEDQLGNVGDGAALGSKAPIWIPDLRATMCMICTSEFTLTWRRHHCRACGKMVCQICSSNKCPLAYLKNQPARVCDHCFDTLQEQSAMNSTAATPGTRSTFAFIRRQKRIPAALKEVTANTGTSSMSGYLMRSKLDKKQGKTLWFVIKDKVLYTYAASEDVAAFESQPLLGFVLKADATQSMQFKLYHQNKLYYIFKADDVQTAQRWIESFKEATVL